ncbi:MAG: hypothetical protein Q9209_005276 [Squamulea sp. 1 TL-2023]
MAMKSDISRSQSTQDDATWCDPISSTLFPPPTEPSSNSSQNLQNTTQTPITAQQHRSLSNTSSADIEVAPAAGIQTVGAESPEVLVHGGSSPPTTPKRRKWKRWFHMVIHLPDGENAMRVTCLDTGADIDVISIHVVNSLGLIKEEYQGPPLKPIGGTYLPQWQVKFDWHIADFYRTYTSTFAVLDEDHSGDFDVLLGRVSVEDIEFYQMNDKVWFQTTNEDTNPSIMSDDAKETLPSIKVDKRSSSD